jgi:hypothetical protein
MQSLSALDTGIPSFDFSNAGEEQNFGSFSAPMDFNDQE